MKNLKLFEQFSEELFEADAIPLLSVLATPKNINFFSDPKDPKSILLAQRDARGAVIPDTTHKYTIKGDYGLMGFDVALRNVRRGKTTGNLYAEAKPTGFVAGKLMGLLPDKNKKGEDLKTADGWLYILVPVDKLNTSIADLVKNQGKKAKIDAGSGVTVTLKYKGPVA
jgi:hypothetical protein